jgi:AraC family transcriptional regulator, alkane utilization regulator
MQSEVIWMGKTIARFADGDLAAQLLRDLRIDSSVLCRSVMAAPWGFGVAGRDVGSFHVVLAGEGWLEVDGIAEPFRIRAGDLAVLPHGDAHRVKDSPATPAPSLTSILAANDIVDGELRFGGTTGPVTEIVCGVFSLEGITSPTWLSRVSPVVMSRPRAGPPDWRNGIGAALRNEARTPTPGGAIVVNRLLESLLVDAFGSELGRSVEDAAAANAIVDRRIGRTIELLREHPETPWTVERLAHEAAMSRSAFSARFRELMGEPPMRYLTEIRLARSAGLLRSTDATVAEIARRVGYRSEESLSRAFKARFGDPPGVFRRRVQIRPERVQIRPERVQIPPEPVRISSGAGNPSDAYG